jgi:hypothetical protein
MRVRRNELCLLPSVCKADRTFTKSQARSLLSIAKLKSARSGHLREISSRTRMDQTYLGWSVSFDRRAIPCSDVVAGLGRQE